MKSFRVKEEVEKIRCSPEQLKQRIAVFYEEYYRQFPIAEILLINSKIPENQKRIKEYMSDMNYCKLIIDDLAKSLNDNSLMGKLKKYLLPIQINKFQLLLRKSYAMSVKYKKENCDINNFKGD